MEDGNLAILVDAKTEYTKQLVTILSPHIYNGIKTVYYGAKYECIEKDETEKTLRLFQTKLSEIPKWNQEVIIKEYDTIIVESKCDWLEDLIMAVFVSHTRILTSINFNKNKNKINLKIPKVDHFIHQCFIEVARSFWKSPYLFDDTINKYDFQRNRREAELIIETQINETIRRQLPVKNILREYLGTDFKEVENEDSLENDDSYKENLRKLVKTEIENCSKEKLEQFLIDTEDDTKDTTLTDTKDTTLTDTKDTTLTDTKDTTLTDTKDTTLTDTKDTTLTDTKDTTLTDTKDTTLTDTKDTTLTDTKDTTLTDTKDTTLTDTKDIGLTEIDLTDTKNNNEIIENNSKNQLSHDINTLNTNIKATEMRLRPKTPEQLNSEDKNEINSIIETEVKKFEDNSNNLVVETLDLDMSDLSQLEEIYDKPNITNNRVDLLKNDESYNNHPHNPPNINLDISSIKPSTDTVKHSLNEIDTYKDSHSEPVKTIIIDTKQGSRDFSEKTNISDSDSDNEMDTRLKKKVYSKYSRKHNYSFFE